MNPNLRYVIFEGLNYDQNNPNNIIIDSSFGISITNPASLPFDVIFDQLSGTSSDRTITVNDGTKSYNIIINSEGRITW